MERREDIHAVSTEAPHQTHTDTPLETTHADTPETTHADTHQTHETHADTKNIQSTHKVINQPINPKHQPDIMAQTDDIVSVTQPRPAIEHAQMPKSPKSRASKQKSWRGQMSAAPTPATEGAGAAKHAAAAKHTAMHASTNANAMHASNADSTAKAAESADELTKIATLPVPIILSIQNHNFLLLQLSDKFHRQHPHLHQISNLTTLFDNNSILNISINNLFSIIRTDEDLIELFEFSELEELTLDIPQLDISISEDSVYSRHIMVNDFTKIYNALKVNSKGEVPICLTFLVGKQRRFITRFNGLNDMVRGREGFEGLDPGASRGRVLPGASESHGPSTSAGPSFARDLARDGPSLARDGTARPSHLAVTSLGYHHSYGTNYGTSAPRTSHLAVSSPSSTHSNHSDHDHDRKRMKVSI